MTTKQISETMWKTLGKKYTIWQRGIEEILDGRGWGFDWTAFQFFKFEQNNFEFTRTVGLSQVQ